jgi:hypothetical protein
LKTDFPLPYLESPPDIYRTLFVLDSNIGSGISTGISNSNEKFNIILFYYSIYSIKSKYRFIKQVLEMLIKRPEGGMVVVFHRYRTLYLDGLIYYRTASFPTGVIYIENNNEVLDYFTPFVIGFIL